MADSKYSCLGWCNDHRVARRLLRRRIEEDHSTQLSAIRGRFGDEVVSLRLVLTTTAGRPVVTPDIALSVFKDTAVALDADQARQLAAGLLRGAELAEQYATSRCRECRTPILPDDELCVLCRGAARRAAGPRLVAVNGETITAE